MRRPTVWIECCLPLAVLALTACARPAPPQAAPQALPVQTATIAAAPVPQFDEYVSTIKGRRSATMQPQVDGNVVRIYVHSGERVQSGQVLMEIDPAKQEATVASSKATEQQKLAVYQYNQIEVDRHAVAALADALTHPVDEDVRGLAADAGIGGRAEVGIRVGARRQLAELRRVLDVDRVHLGARDDRHVPGNIDDVVLGAEDGGEGPRRRQNLLLDRHVVHVELLHLHGGLRARRISRGGRRLGRRRRRRRGRCCRRGCRSGGLRRAQWCQGRQRKAGGEPKTVGIVHRFGACA